MIVHTYGNKEAKSVLLQMVDDHDLSVIEKEVTMIQELVKNDFHMLAVKTNRWNHDLSPWQAPPVFGKDAFGGGARETLQEILDLTQDSDKIYYIGGYSLAGLFALWASYQTNIFKGVAAASPSVWFPGFLEYMKSNEIQTGIVYLSLGDKEEKTRNQVMASVGECIREAFEDLRRKSVRCTLEWNQGNHFQNSDLRTAQAFAWVMNQTEMIGNDFNARKE